MFPIIENAVFIGIPEEKKKDLKYGRKLLGLPERAHFKSVRKDSQKNSTLWTISLIVSSLSLSPSFLGKM